MAQCRQLRRDVRRLYVRRTGRRVPHRLHSSEGVRSKSEYHKNMVEPGTKLCCKAIVLILSTLVHASLATHVPIVTLLFSVLYTFAPLYPTRQKNTPLRIHTRSLSSNSQNTSKPPSQFFREYSFNDFLQGCKGHQLPQLARGFLALCACLCRAIHIETSCVRSCADSCGYYI